ncbi:MAG: DUF2461 domain-containing protein [Thermoplasmata archaeon]|nr:DUF2461 domain-containing protein [Thermoplasmata archaeon]MCI4356233.1 DUF2461 domain-containing protein [Thermoplasmata archaeon]
MTATSAPSFSPDLFRFFRDLERHNNRAWFQSNKPRYESTVLEPAVRFVKEVEPGMAKMSPHIVADARPYGGSVSRIYRDVRFSRDKSPYRTNVGIHFAHAESVSSEEHLPGVYLHLEPGESMVSAGVWQPSAAGLGQIRDRIVAKPKDWSRAILQAPLTSEEAYVRVPAGYDANHEFADDLRRKDFVTSLKFSDAEVTAPGFRKKFLDAALRTDPVNRFLAGALRVPW